MVELVAAPGATSDPTAADRWMIDFGPVVVGDARTVEFGVQNRGTATARMSVRVLDGVFESTAPSRLGPGDEAKVAFHFQPTEAREAQAIAEIRAGESVLYVRLVGNGFVPRLDCPERLEERVPVGGNDVFAITCKNESPAAIVLKGSTSGSFWIVTAPDEVEAGEEAVFEIGANVAAPATHEGLLSIESGDHLAAEVELVVEVFEQAHFKCTPESLLFEDVIVGDPDFVAERQVIECTNEGRVSAVPVVEVSGTSFIVEVTDQPVEARASFEVGLTFAPTVPRAFTDVIRIVPSDGGTAAEVVVEAIAFPPPDCNLEMGPLQDGTFHFHSLPAGFMGWPKRDLVLRVTGEGCEIRNLRVEQGAPTFTLQPEQPTSFAAPAGEMAIPLQFRPVDSGSDLEGELRFQVLGEDSERSLRLVGRKDACLGFIDEFGFQVPYASLPNVAAGCSAAAAPIFLHNHCETPVELTSITPHLPWPVTEAHFRLVEKPDLPTTLQQGESVSVVIEYDNPDRPTLAGAFTFGLADGRSIWLELEGMDGPPSRYVDIFTPDWPAVDAVDVLFVVDDGPGAEAIQTLLTGRYDALVAGIGPEKTWRMAFTTTAGAPCSRTAGELHAVLDADSGSAAALDAWVAPEVCDAPVDPFGATIEALDALEGGWPHQADLHVVFVTNDKDVGTTRVEALLQQLVAGMDEGGRAATVHLVEPAPPPGPNQLLTDFHVAVRATGGSVHLMTSATQTQTLGAAFFRNDRLLPLRFPVGVEENGNYETLQVRTRSGDEMVLEWPTLGGVERWKYLPAVGAVRVTEVYRADPPTMDVGYAPMCMREDVTAPAWP